MTTVERTLAPRTRWANKTPLQALSLLGVWVVAAVAILVSIVPVLYVIINGFRSNMDINNNPGGLPSPWITKNYVDVLTSPRFWGSLETSLIIGVLTTLGVVVLGLMAAFVIARYNFGAQGAMYGLFAAGLMFPLTVASLPLSLMIRDIGLQGRFAGVILPQIAFALPTTIIILVPFLKAIPEEIEEAATVDGASRMGFFWRIVLPLSLPGLITVGVLAFIGSWNAYLLPLLVLGAAGVPLEQQTLPLGAAQFSSQYAQNTGGVLAYTAISMIPALVFFLVAEKHIVGGLAGAVKG